MPRPDHAVVPARATPTLWSARNLAVGLVLAAAMTLALVGPAAAGGAVTTVSHHLLTWWKAAILGVVEGLTEFLPISSTGHLLVAARVLNLPHAKGSAGLDAVNTYAVAIQFGAILAVLGLFWRRFVEMVRGLFGRSADGRHLLIIVVIAFVPSAVLGVALDKTIEDALFGPWPVIIAWVVGGGVILALARSGRLPSRAHRDVSDVTEVGNRGVLAITYRQAAIIGAAQCLALWPGTSRSLATIVAALLLGVAMPAAVEFSFLLGFLTLSAATGFKLLKDGGTLVDQFGIANPLIGALFALVAAVIAVRWLITYLERHDLTVFAWYRFAIAALTIVLVATSAI